MKKTMFLAALMGAVVLTAPATAAVSYTRAFEAGDSVTLGEQVSMDITPILLTIDLTKLGEVTTDTELINLNSGSGGRIWGLRAQAGGNVTGTWGGNGNWSSRGAWTTGGTVQYSTIQGLAEAESTTVTLLATLNRQGTALAGTDENQTSLYSSAALASVYGSSPTYLLDGTGIVTAANKAIMGNTISNISGDGTLTLDANMEINGGADGGSVTIALNGKSLTVTGDTTLSNIKAENSSLGGGITVKEGVTLTSDINTGWHPGNITVEDGAKIVANEVSIATNNTSSILGAGSLTTNSLHTGNGGKIISSIAEFTVNGNVTIGGDGEQTDTITVTDGTFHVTGDISMTAGRSQFVVNGGTVTVDGTISGVGTVSVGEGQTLTAGAINGNKITLAAGSTIELGTDHDGTLTTSSMTVNGDATINADLVFAANSSITFTEGSVTLGCSIDFGTGTTIALGEAYLSQLETDGMVLLFTGVDDVTGLENVVVTGDFATGHLVKVQEGSAWSIYATPEPATATLSLLALAGLMARRKRH